MTLPCVAVILLNWNNHQDTLNCCELLEKLDFPPEQFSIIVVDNHSDEISKQELLKKSNLFYLICLNENLGFAAGNNAGIQYALDNNFAFIWILNSDVVFEPDLLQKTLKVFEHDSSAGIVSPKIHYASPPGKIWYAGGSKRSFLFNNMVGLNKIDTGQFDQMRKVDFGVGCSMLIRSDVFQKIGLLDESFFFYNEDIDFCYRAQRAGYSIWYQPASLLLHRVSNSTQKQPALKYYLYASSKVTFYKKYIGFTSLPALLLIEGLRFVQLSLRLGYHGQWSSIGAYLRGLLAGLRRA